jgi:hypothetical protein
VTDNAHPFDRVIAALSARGTAVRWAAGRDSVRARCPAHDDRRPSLVVTRGDRVALVKCFAGCRTEAVVGALGLRLSDLGRQASTTTGASAALIEAAYDYHNAAGEVVAQKLRRTGKRFSWRRPDATAPGGWRSGLGGITLPGPYRWPTLVGANTIFVTEGEKAADLLFELRLVATCGSAGATTWKLEWTRALLDAVADGGQIVVLPDYDRAGEQHAERVATDLARQSARVTIKVLPLPHLQRKEDVVDWLRAGHPVDELLSLVDATPVWTAGGMRAARAARKRAAATERVRRHRARIRGKRPWKTSVRSHAFPAVLEAVRHVLAEQAPRSQRAVCRALRGEFARKAVESALREGVQAGMLAVTTTGNRGAAAAYRLADPPTTAPRSPTCGPDIQGVTSGGHTADIHSVTSSGHLEGVPPSDDTQVGQKAPEVAHPECPDVVKRVTPVNGSGSLQETSSLGASGVGTGRERRRNRSRARGNTQRKRTTATQRAQAAQAVARGCCGTEPGSVRGEPYRLWCKLCRNSPTCVL